MNDFGKITVWYLINFGTLAPYSQTVIAAVGGYNHRRVARIIGGVQLILVKSDNCFSAGHWFAPQC